MPDRSIDIVLFDIAGVLIEFGAADGMKALTGIQSDEEFWQRWLDCDWVREFDQGRCSEHDFATGVIDDWRLLIDAETFLDSFRDWQRPPLPGAAELLQSVRRKVSVGCLSNTNALHWTDPIRHWTDLDTLDFRFLSFQLGLLKPDRRVFDRVAELLPVPTNRVFFLDDNEANVDGAIAAGYQAARTVGVAAARDALVASGVLADGE